MAATLFRLRAEPDQRLDLSAITPERLHNLSRHEIAALPIGTTRMPLRLADVFAVRLGERDRIRFEGGSERFDRLGAGLRAGEIRVEGDVGQAAGIGMSGGRIEIEGSAGPLAGALMAGGGIFIAGNAGDGAGGATPGVMAGMRGGFLLVAGRAGERLGDRMRRGCIAALGPAGAYAGSRMGGGTLLAAAAGPLPGYLMRRGTLVLGAHDGLAPSFVNSGVHQLQFLGLLRAWLRRQDARASALVPLRAERFQGDMATLGRGEILVARI
jgi:formylmethanofuran dehydrogenase subunit C